MIDLIGTEVTILQGEDKQGDAIAMHALVQDDCQDDGILVPTTGLDVEMAATAAAVEKVMDTQEDANARLTDSFDIDLK